jgi:NADPH:quinone reductase-like Zn-dependent oxidoreductase
VAGVGRSSAGRQRQPDRRRERTAAAHGVHMSHGAPVDEAGTAIGAADPLALHGLAIATELAEQGRLRVPIAAAFPLAEAAAAHELSETRHARGRIVLVS